MRWAEAWREAMGHTQAGPKQAGGTGQAPTSSRALLQTGAGQVARGRFVLWRQYIHNEMYNEQLAEAREVTLFPAIILVSKPNQGFSALTAYS